MKILRLLNQRVKPISALMHADPKKAAAVSGVVTLTLLPMALGCDLISATSLSSNPDPATDVEYSERLEAQASLDVSGEFAASQMLVEWDMETRVEAPPETESPEFDCMIEPWEAISIRSPISGRIDRIHVERADRIEAGDLLLEIDADLARANLDVETKRAEMIASIGSLEARESLGVRRSKRAIRLHAQGALTLNKREEILTERTIASFDLLDARDKHALAKLQLAREQARFEQRRVRSPVSGIVADRLMSVGEVVDEETVLEIAQIDPLRVEVILPAVEFGTIQPGMKAAVVPETQGDAVLVATVNLVDGIIDSASGTFGAILELPNPEHKIPGGLRCRVHFVGAEPDPDELVQAEPDSR